MATLHLCASHSAGCVPEATAHQAATNHALAMRSQTQYAPGEGVLVTFDFSGAERLCRLLTVSLHTRERYRGHALGGSSAETLGESGGEIVHETLVTSCQRDIDLSNPDEQHEKVSAQWDAGGADPLPRGPPSDFSRLFAQGLEFAMDPGRGDAVFHHEHH